MVTRIFDLHFHQLKNYPKKDALTAKINGEWVPTSTESFIDQAYQFGLGLLEKGLNPGDKVALISNNRPEWHIIDLGIAMAGMINVPIYPTITEEDYRYILNDAEAKLCFVADDELFQKVNSIIDQVSSLSNIYTIDKLPNREHWTSIKDLGKDKDKKTLDTIMDGIKETDLATLIYTSGTTGRPKGVMLSHKNLVSNSVTSRDRLPVTSNSKSLSFLPLCHVYERMVTYMYIYVGTSIYYAESLETIGDNLKEVKPDVF
ncbi:MAG: AMP-binding protein, partial [Flavobacteriales bacterium]|nr:AMP-binding protein [Flavobacteriales bacterium]